jgi:hypothetical protein
MPATASIAAIGTTLGHCRSPEKVNTSASALTRAEHDFYVVNKILLCHIPAKVGKYE